jgi:hypothetical protein
MKIPMKAVTHLVPQQLMIGVCGSVNSTRLSTDGSTAQEPFEGAGPCASNTQTLCLQFFIAQCNPNNSPGRYACGSREPLIFIEVEYHSICGTCGTTSQSQKYKDQ